MEYWVAMNGTELRISLLLLGKTGISGVIEVSPDFSPKESELEEMVKKNFFQRDEDGMTWNPFVKMVLWSAANAQSELRIRANDQPLSCLYFYNDIMILMSKESNDDAYIFYFVPLLPKAIGGLTKSLENLESVMQVSAVEESRSMALPNETLAGSESIGVLTAQMIPNQIRSKNFPLTIDGWCFREHTLECVLVQTQDTYWIVSKDRENLHLSSTGFYDFIEFMSHWIVRVHGKSIAAKESENV